MSHATSTQLSPVQAGLIIADELIPLATEVWGLLDCISDAIDGSGGSITRNRGEGLAMMRLAARQAEEVVRQLAKLEERLEEKE